MKAPYSNPFVSSQKFSRHFRNSLPSVLAVCGAMALLPQVSEAANITWDGGAALKVWNDPVNWAGDVLPAAADTVLFRDTGLPASTVISLGASQTVRKLQMDAYSNVNSFTIGSAADISAGHTLTLTDVYRDTNNGNTQTIAANVVLAADSTWNIINGYNGSVAVTGGVGSASDVVLSKEGSNTLTMSGVNTFTGSVRVLGGGLALSNTNAYTGTTAVSGGGSISLNFGAATATNIINSASTLELGGIRGGGSLTVNGRNLANVVNSQAFGGLRLNPAASTLNIVNGINTGKTVVSLGAITRNSGSTVNFVQPTVFTTISAQNGYTTSTSNDASGILGAYATVGGTDWASNNLTNIVAYTGYTVLAGAAPSVLDGVSTNVRINSTSTGDVGQAAGTITVNTLNVNDAAARTVTVGSGNTLRLGALGGILSTGTGGLTVGASGNAGTLTAGGADNTAGEVVLNNSTALVVNSVIADNGSGGVSLTKSGAGTTALTAANTYTGTTTLNAGILTFAPYSIKSSATTNANSTVTVASTAGLVVGQTVSGSGIPAFTRIASINANGTQLTLSQNATATNATANLVYYTGNTTSLSSTTADPKTVTVDTTGLSVGQTVTGTGIPDSTKIASILNGTTLVLDKAATTSGTVNLTYGSSTRSSTTIDGKTVTVASTAGLVVGQLVTGTGIPAYATIASITDGTTYVLSSAATAAGTVSLAYSNNALSTAGNITVNGGTLELGSSTAAQTTTGAFVLAAGSLSNGTITKSGANFDVRSGTINTRLAGSAGLDKTTAGTLTFSNTVSNTFTGDTTITEGTINAAANVIAINGNLIVGSASGGGSGAFYNNNGSNIGFNAGKNITVYSNGSVNLGSGSQNLNGGIQIIGGSLAGSQIYQNTTINMTGGTFGGNAYGNSNSYVTNASASTAVISAWLQADKPKNFTVADGDAAIDLLFSGGVATNSNSIVKSGAGKMVISSEGLGNTGSVTINAGTLSVAKLADGAATSSIGASPAAATNLRLGNGTTLQYTGTGHSTNRLFTINGTSAGHGATLDASGTGAVNFTNAGSLAYGTANQTRTLILAGSSAANNTLAAAIGNNGSGVVSVTKNGSGKWILSGTIDYTGNTVVNGGTLSIAAATLSDTSRVEIAGDAFLNLTHAFTNTVDSLYINGVQQAAGVWGAIGSGATHQTARITGTGKLDVINGAVSSDPFTTWIDTFAGLTDPADKAKAADPDKDGVSNLAEFAFKGNPENGSDNGLTASLLQDTIAPVGNELTYIIAVRDGANFTAGASGIRTATVAADSLTYTVQGSLNLDFPRSAVSHVSVSATAPVATGLPDLTGTDWEYHTFRLDASEGTAGKGFLRAMVTVP